MRGDHAAASWTDHVLDVMAPDAVIVSWWSYSTPLWYAQRVEGRRPDITIVDDRTRLDEHLGGLTDVIDANLPTRPVYVIRLDRSEVALLAQRYQLDYIDGSRRQLADPRRGAADGGRLARPALALGIDVERVDEVAEDVEPRVDDVLAGRLERRALPALALVDDPAVAAEGRLLEHGVGREDPDARADRRGPARPTGRASTSIVRPSRWSMIRAWNVSSASSLMTTRSIRAPSSSRVVANRSWVSGRSGVRPWSFIAIALASHGPIQIGR